MWKASAQFRAHDGSTSVRTWEFDLPAETKWSTQVIVDGKALLQTDGVRLHVRHCDWIVLNWVGSGE